MGFNLFVERQSYSTSAEQEQEEEEEDGVHGEQARDR
jgi:hypothetical protein